MQDYQRIAQAFIDQLHKDVDDLIRSILRNHHLQHEQGADRVLIPMRGIKDTSFSARPAEDAAIIYVRGTTQDDDYWTDGEATGGGGSRQFGYQVPGALAVSLGGPQIPNITGATITFTTAIATVGTAPTGDDIDCSLDVDGTTVSFTISAGNNASTKQTGLSVAWAADTLITGAIATVGSTIAGSDLSMVLAE